MTLPPDPTLFLAHCYAHKAESQNPTLQRAKNANACPPTPADEYQSSFVQLTKPQNVSVRQTSNVNDKIKKMFNFINKFYKQ
jgi:hypothetical protein